VRGDLSGPIPALGTYSREWPETIGETEHHGTVWRLHMRGGGGAGRDPAS